jgi:signal transduction histidine kinase
MIFKPYEWRLLLRIVLLFLVLLATSGLWVNSQKGYAALLIPIVIFQLYDLFRLLKKTQDEVMDFATTIHYRDFSRNFNVKQAPYELQPLREGFNEINSTFRDISREKEIQYMYLQKILELIHTGILSYRVSDGEIVWINQAWKKMMNIPYLKNINALENRDANTYEAIMTLTVGESQVIKLISEKKHIKVLLSATAFQTEGQLFKLIAFQNINEALDETEAEAWRKLLSVMTHEIMNSVAPISSLAETLKTRVQQFASSHPPANEGLIEDLGLGIETIKRRSEGLLKFAETYRNLNKIVKPNLKKVYVRDLFENLYHLMQPTLEQKEIDLEVILKEPDLMIEVDPNLIDQVLINLVINAMEAVKEQNQPRIILSAFQEYQKPYIKLADNGVGITPELLEQIFIPFFSTKKGGSGIGLSLCKQIMLLHKGNIQVQSKIGEGSVFVLSFKA